MGIKKAHVHHCTHLLY